jgi:regulator of protease activity HflC (stomatin/prohibitin superfamily)
MNKTTCLITVFAAFLLSGCSTANPGAGYEAVLVEKPLIFGHGGVNPEPIKAGRTIIALTTEDIYVDMRPQQFAAHFDDLMSSDGVPLDFDAVVRLQVVDSVKLIRQFGTDWYKSNVERELANRLRQAVRKHGMNETAISTTAIDAIDNEVSSAMEQYIKASGLPVKLIQITVGKANPPDSIKNQRVETAAQQQRILTEGQKKLAEDARKSAELSRAEADNAYRQAMQLSPEQFLALERIKMQQAVCAGGHCTFIFGNATPIINNK